MCVINHTTIDQSVATHNNNETDASLTFCVCARPPAMVERIPLHSEGLASRNSEQDISNSQIFTSEQGRGHGDLQREPPLELGSTNYNWWILNTFLSRWWHERWETPALFIIYECRRPHSRSVGTVYGEVLNVWYFYYITTRTATCDAC